MPPTAYHSTDLYALSKQLVIACYALTHDLPEEERTNLTRFLRTAAVTAHLTIAQGTLLQKKKKRKKAFQTILNALVVMNTAAEVLVEVGLVPEENTVELRDLSAALTRVVKTLKKEL